MSLKNPSVKMSKSDEDPNAYILIKDDPDTIRRKIARAVTDSEAHFTYSDDQPGLKNLINIFSAYDGRKPQEIVVDLGNISYADFKELLGETIVNTMSPIRDRFLEITADKNYLDDIYKRGAEEAGRAARRTLSKVYRKVGFIEH